MYFESDIIQQPSVKLIDFFLNTWRVYLFALLTVYLSRLRKKIIEFQYLRNVIILLEMWVDYQHMYMITLEYYVAYISKRVNKVDQNKCDVK